MDFKPGEGASPFPCTVAAAVQALVLECSWRVDDAWSKLQIMLASPSGHGDDTDPCDVVLTRDEPSERVVVRFVPMPVTPLRAVALGMDHFGSPAGELIVWDMPCFKRICELSWPSYVEQVRKDVRRTPFFRHGVTSSGTLPQRLEAQPRVPSQRGGYSNERLEEKGCSFAGLQPSSKRYGDSDLVPQVNPFELVQSGRAGGHLDTSGGGMYAGPNSSIFGGLRPRHQLPSSSTCDPARGYARFDHPCPPLVFGNYPSGMFPGEPNPDHLRPWTNDEVPPFGGPRLNLRPTKGHGDLF